MDAPVKDKAVMGSNDLADKDTKMSAGNAMSTTNLLAPDKSGLTRRPYKNPTNAKAKIGKVMVAICENNEIS